MAKSLPARRILKEKEQLWQHLYKKIIMRLYLKNLKILVAMQLKEKLDMGYLKKTKTAILKIMLPVFAFAIITVSVWLVLFLTRRQGILGNPIPVETLVFFFSVVMLISMLVTTYSMMKSLYFSFDNQILLTMPVPASQIFLSKLAVYYIVELKRSITYILPIFLAFGIISGLNVGFYFILPLAFIVVSFIPVIIGAFLSVPLLYFTLFLKRFKAVQYVLAAAVATVIIVLLFRIANAIPADFDPFERIVEVRQGIDSFLIRFAQAFAPFTYLVTMMTGRITIIPFIGIRHITVTGQSTAIAFATIAVCVAFLLLAFVVIRPLYFKMVSKHLENKKREIKKQKENVRRSPFVSILKKELLLRFRTPQALVHTIAGIMFLPFSIFLLNRIYGALNTRYLGDMVALTTNFLILILIMTTQHIRAASIFSSEGKAVYILKTTPDTVKANIAAKMLLDILLSAGSLIATVIIISRTNNLVPVVTAFVFFSVLLCSIAHICWSIELDITNPQYLQIKDGVHETTNSNETKSMIIACVISFLLAGLATLFMLEDLNTAWVKIFFIALAFVVLRGYLLVTNIKVYFKEM